MMYWVGHEGDSDRMIKCQLCHRLAAHLTDTGLCFVCDGCILSGKLAFCGLTKPPNPGVYSALVKTQIPARVPVSLPGLS